MNLNSFFGFILYSRNSDVIEQLDQFCTESRSRLKKKSIVIKPCRRWFYFVLFPPLFFWIGWFIYPDSPPLGASIGAALGLAFGIYLFIKFSTEMRLTRSGVSLIRGGRRVFFPWELLESSGNGLTIPQLKLLLPVRVEYLPAIRLFKGKDVVAEGAIVSVDFFKVIDRHQISIDTGFSLSPDDLVAYLFSIADNFYLEKTEAKRSSGGRSRSSSSSRSTSRSKRKSSPREKEYFEGISGFRENSKAVANEYDGELCIPITRLDFPQYCFSCLKGTGAYVLVSFLSPPLQNTYLEVEMPCCRRCKYNHWFRSLMGIFSYWGVFSVLFGGLVFLFLLVFDSNSSINLELCSFSLMGGMIFSAILTYWTWQRYARQLLTKVRGNYSPSDQALYLKFSESRFTKKVAKYLR